MPSHEPATLKYATIELNTVCNWRCKHCYIPNHDSIGLSYDTLIKLFTDLRRLNTFELTLTGGEIFLRPDIMSLLTEARKLGFHLHLFTNISLLNEPAIITLRSINIGLISCTLFSMNPLLHDAITCSNGSLNDTLSNAQLLKKQGIPLEVKVILLSSNYAEYRAVKRYCDENGFDFLATANIFPRTDGDTSPQADAVTESQLMDILSDIDGYRGFIGHQFSDKNKLCDQCNGIENSIYVDCTGRIFPCNNMLYEVGNIFDDSLCSVWYHSERLNYIRSLQCSDLIHCTQCEFKNYCYRCPGVALSETGSLFERVAIECMHSRLRHHLSSVGEY